MMREQKRNRNQRYARNNPWKKPAFVKGLRLLESLPCLGYTCFYYLQRSPKLQSDPQPRGYSSVFHQSWRRNRKATKGNGFCTNCGYWMEPYSGYTVIPYKGRYCEDCLPSDKIFDEAHISLLKTE